MAVDSEALRALQESARASVAMLRELQQMRQSQQAAADMARRFSTQQAHQRQEDFHQRPLQTNQPMSETAARMSYAAHAGAMLGGFTDSTQNAAPPNQTMPGAAARAASNPVDEAIQSQQHAGPENEAEDDTPQGSQQQPQAGATPSSGGNGAGTGGNGAPPAEGSTGGATGSSPGGAGISGMASHIPVVGGAISDMIKNNPLQKGLNLYSSQRDKDDYYRSIEGGGHLNAMKERLGEEWNARKDVLAMSSGETRAAYKDITRMGFTDADTPGYQRGDLMAFVGQAKTHRGQSESESIGQLQTWLDNGSASLKGFQQALDSVSDTARKAGVNTQMARTQMQSYFDLVTSTGGGAGSNKIASALVNSNLANGRSTSQQLNNSGAVSEQFEYMAASNAGMDIGQFEVEKRKGSKKYFNAINQQQARGVRDVFSPDEIQWVKDYAKQHPDASNVRIANAWVNYMQTTDKSGLRLETITSMLAPLVGESSSNPIALMTWAVGQILGKNRIKADTKKSAAGGKGGGEAKKGGIAGAAARSIGGTLKDDAKAVGSGLKDYFFGFLDGDDDGDSKKNKSTDTQSETKKKKKTTPSKSSAGDSPQTSSSSHRGQNSSTPTRGSAAPSDFKIKIDATPEAKKLIKAMVVTGGDPYSLAAAASSGRPKGQSGNPTR